jgi:methionyl-tRNA formyltransferase
VRAFFFGTPAIAVPALEATAEIAEIAAVICQPDRPAGRGLEQRAPPVKVRAAELGLAVVQPAKIRTPEFAAFVLEQRADVAVVIAYGRILPPAVLEAPARGCLNLHASLLPKYRGAAPITWALVNGETETGISLMQMDEGMDTGPVFSQHRIAIGPEMTADELARELGRLAAEVVRSDLGRAVQGALTALPQDHAGATMAPILEKEHGRVSFARPAHAVHDHVRGMTSWPGAFTTALGKRLLVLESRTLAEAPLPAPPGTVVAATRAGIDVACSPGTLRILRAQIEGRKALAAAELVAGRTLREGMVLGA